MLRIHSGLSVSSVSRQERQRLWQTQVTPCQAVEDGKWRLHKNQNFRGGILCHPSKRERKFVVVVCVSRKRFLRFFWKFCFLEFFRLEIFNEIFCWIFKRNILLFNFIMMMRRKNGSGELLATTVWSSTGTQSSLAKARLLLRLIKGWTAPTFWKRREKFWVLIWLPARMTKSFARRIYTYMGTRNKKSNSRQMYPRLSATESLPPTTILMEFLLARWKRRLWIVFPGFDFFAAVFPGSAVVSEFGRLWEKDPRELLQHNIKPVRGHALVLWRVAQGDFVMFC